MPKLLLHSIPQNLAIPLFTERERERERFNEDLVFCERQQNRNLSRINPDKRSGSGEQLSVYSQQSAVSSFGFLVPGYSITQLLKSSILNMTAGVIQNMVTRVVRLLLQLACRWINTSCALPQLYNANGSISLTVKKKGEYYKNRDKREFILQFW